MKKVCLSLLYVLIPFFLLAQQANSWITYSQYYYKIKVAKDGIYRIDSATLAAAGIPLTIVNPQDFQLFFHGQEQYIYVKGQANGVFNGPKSGNDYIEFYGQHNTGSLIKNDAVVSDSMLYAGITSFPDSGIKAVPNPYYSMFNDTSTYYLTWGNSVSFHRMTPVQPDTTFSSNTPFPYFIAQSINFGNVSYCAGTRLDLGGGDEINDPRYTSSVGWFYSDLAYGGTQTINLSGVTNIYTSGPTVFVKTFFEGQSIAPVLNDHEIKVTGSWASGTLTDTTFTGFGTCLKKYNISASQIAGSTGKSPVSITYNSVSISSAAPYGNHSAISYVFTQYPHTMDLGGASNFMMYVRDTTNAAKTYLNLSNLNAINKDTVRVYDLTNHNRYVVTQRSGYKLLMPNTPGITRQSYLTSDTQITKITKLVPVGSHGTFTSFSGPYQTPYIIIYHPLLSAEATMYSQYRQKKYGSDVVFANVEELYDQFGYGIEKDPLAIRNFCSYIIGKSKLAPAGLFLIGKGIHSYMARQDTNLYNANLLPSFGYPSSDVLLTAGLNSSFGPHSLEPAIPTGRLPATDNTQVSNYLNKVEVFESNAPALWMKNIIHFAGGNAGIEQNNILSYLNTDAGIAQDTFYGAHVYTIQKTSTSPIQITLSDSVADLINNGVSLMTFFGHASGTNFDINLDAPSDYTNVGKYPMVIALACLSGDMFQPIGGATSSTSEQFVLDPKGSIGFIAMDALGELTHLGNYSNFLYGDFSNTMYRKPIGLSIQNSAARIQGISSGLDMVGNCVAMEMQLDGDPAIAINPNDSLPDYAVSDTSLTFMPTNVTTQIDSFKVKLSVLNLAKAVNGPVQVEIDRLLPDDTVKTRIITLNNIYNERDTTLTYPVDKVNGVGMNYFSIKVDPANLIKEITKSNNDISKINLWITSGNILPVYPYQFAIIPKDTTTLKASTGDPFAPAHPYIFEIDTTINFNSGFLKTQIISAKGGVVRAPCNTWVNTPFTPPTSTTPTKGNILLLLKDSTVYYWRVRQDTSDTKDYGWQNSSFQYIKGKAGWGQSHFYQFDNNQYTYLQQQLPQRNWIFNPTGKKLTITTVGLPLGPYLSNKYSTGAFATGYYLDLTPEASNSCSPTPAMNLAVIDPVSLTPWSTQNYNLGNDNNASAGGCEFPDNRFMYWSTDANAVKGLEAALNSIPNGDYIVMYSFRESMLQSFPDAANLRTLLNKLGADPTINKTSDSVPWIFFVQKGNKASARTIIGVNDSSQISYSVTLSNNNSFGSMVSPIIGPAQKWDSISWRQHPLVKNAQDSVRLNVNAIDNNGNSSVLLKGVSPAVANMFITSVNPKQYPYLQLMLYTKDAATHTPSQMNKWQVFYTPVPEVAVNPSIYYSFYKDTLYGGDTIRLKTVVQNIGDYAMDSMYVSSWITDPNGSSHYISGLKRTKKLNPGDTAFISVKTSTNQFSGNNNLWLEVNPPYLPQTRPEEFYFNNYIRKSFTALGDKNSPLLDVTFDGVHILNNDIVSPKPNILMELTSDNKFLALNSSDTSNFAVYLRNINSSVAQRIYFGAQMRFTPAVLPNNRCKVLYTPILTDGTYELTVQAADRSGNLSATNSYKVDFVVVNKSSITNVLNYPNPFSTSTRFVFTLTGDQIPTYFKIQIITITGKVIREITEGELGPIHIGRNITQYAWDGTDQFGSKVGNGVYLYRVVSSIDNQSIDHMATNADSFFTKGWGKMYIIR